MIDPLPYSFSMLATASSMALLRFFGSSMRRLLRPVRLPWASPRLYTASPFSGKPSAAFFPLILLAGCDQTTPTTAPPDPPMPPMATPSAIAKRLGFDASTLGEIEEAPPPAGDLRDELDTYVGLDACVSRRAKIDPLFGDALLALGYDSFPRDACRFLE